LIFIKAAIPVRLLASPSGGVGRVHVALRECPVGAGHRGCNPHGRSQKDLGEHTITLIAKQLASFGPDRS
jgi:hypothetical protein